MAKISIFITAVNSNNNLGLYCWGGNGELTTEVSGAWIKNKETSVSNANKVIKKWKANYGKPGVRLMDCSGLIVYGLRTSGAKSKSFDITAEGLRKMCTAIDKKELRDGDLCFRMSDGEAVHVGMYIGGRVIESRGRDYGVVTRSLSAAGWSKYGRLNIKWEDEPKKYVLTRVLKKGCQGSDVLKLQETLIKLGYNLQNKKGSLKNNGADSDFGQITKEAVMSFQRNSGISVDGKVGSETAGVLGWEFRKR